MATLKSLSISGHNINKPFIVICNDLIFLSIKRDSLCCKVETNAGQLQANNNKLWLPYLYNSLLPVIQWPAVASLQSLYLILSTLNSCIVLPLQVSQIVSAAFLITYSTNNEYKELLVFELCISFQVCRIQRILVHYILLPRPIMYIPCSVFLQSRIYYTC